MNELTAQLREFTKSMGVDILGIAPISRFNDVPANHHPASIFPEVKSILVIAKRITRGSLRGIEEGTQFMSYAVFGHEWLNNRVLATATFRTSEFLENNGWEAVPVPNLPPEVPPMGVSVRPDLPAPNVMIDFNDAAVRAGLGEIGYCGLLLTPEFGPRQRIQIILTDAELIPTPLLQKPVCLHCQDTAGICPLGAIHGQNSLTIAGKQMTVAEIDHTRCATCKNGAFANSLHTAGKTDRCAALCTRNCMVRLEAEGQLANTFQNSFRNREAWGIVDEHKVL